MFATYLYTLSLIKLREKINDKYFISINADDSEL